MGTERSKINFTVAGNTYQINGAKWFYTNNTVKGIIGASVAGTRTSGTTRQGTITTNAESAKRVLIKLVMTYKSAAGSVVGNAAQTDRPKRFTFLCDPDKAEDAIVKLPDKSIGGRKILRVYRPLKRCYV